MKYTFRIIFFFCFLTAVIFNAFAQQGTKVDEALLLDYYQTQRYKEANDYLKQTYHEPVTDLKALSRLAYTSQMAGKLPEAEGYYLRVYNQDTTNRAALYSLAVINYKRGNMLKAEGFYMMILRKDSLNFAIYKQLAQISNSRGDTQSYIAYLQKANKLNAQDPDVASDLSDIFVSLRFLPQAEKILNAAISGDPENVILLESLVKLTYAQHKWPETIATAEKLMALGDNPLPVLSKLGQAYYITKSYQCGIEIFKSIDENSQNETTYYFTGLCYKALKDQKKAVDYFVKAITAGLSPNIDSYYNEMADSYHQQKLLKKAIAAFQKALQFDEKPMTYYSIASLYDNDLKDKTNAIKFYHKYLDARPSGKDQQSYIDYSQHRIAELSH